MKRWLSAFCAATLLAAVPFVWFQPGWVSVFQIRLDKVQAGMSLAETQELLGPGKKFHISYGYIEQDGTTSSLHESYLWPLPDGPLERFNRDSRPTLGRFRGIEISFVDGHVVQKQFFK